MSGRIFDFEKDPPKTEPEQSTETPASSASSDETLSPTARQSYEAWAAARKPAVESSPELNSVQSPDQDQPLETPATPFEHPSVIAAKSVAAAPKLLPCPDCAQPISTYAESCPHCGRFFKSYSPHAHRIEVTPGAGWIGKIAWGIVLSSFLWSLIAAVMFLIGIIFLVAMLGIGSATQPLQR
jgi:hypothetical protein